MTKIIEKQIFSFGINNLFSLHFTVDFLEDSKDNKYLESKKANILLEVDEEKSFKEAKEDFAEFVGQIVIDALMMNEFEKTLRSWGFKRHAVSEIKNSKRKEIKAFNNSKKTLNINLAEINNDEMYSLSPAMMIRQDSTKSWKTIGV